MARLKVYALDIDGLHDWAVAAPNQRAALDAVGMNRNLFADGQARVAEDPEAIAAALAHPGEAVKKLKGSAGAFAPDPDKTAGWEAALKAAPKTARAKPSKAEAARLAKIDKTKAALEALDSEQAAAHAALEAERAALEARAEKAQGEFETKRARLKRDLKGA